MYNHVQQMWENVSHALHIIRAESMSWFVYRRIKHTNLGTEFSTLKETRRVKTSAKKSCESL